MAPGSSANDATPRGPRLWSKAGNRLRGQAPAPVLTVCRSSPPWNPRSSNARFGARSKYHNLVSARISAVRSTTDRLGGARNQRRGDAGNRGDRPSIGVFRSSLGRESSPRSPTPMRAFHWLYPAIEPFPGMLQTATNATVPTRSPRFTHRIPTGALLCRGIRCAR